MKRVASLAAALVMLCPALSWAQSPAETAFARQDFAQAQALWQIDAAAGDPQAMLGLGLLLDRGYGGQRDPAAAFAWYRKAADLGLAEAQFNIAVMFDAGLGQTRAPQDALIWYTRAALRGHARAQYNLGLFYDSAQGEMHNPALAQYWYGAAAAVIPAAEEKLRPLDEIVALSAPQILFAETAEQREIVWTTAGFADGFVVEDIALPQTDVGFDPSILSAPVAGSGLLTDRGDSEPAATRVLTLAPDATAYAASAWVGDGPLGRITLMADPASPAMMATAEMFAQDLQAAGYWTNVRTDGEPGAGYVTYGFDQDLDLARIITTYLPKPAHPVDQVQKGDSLRPGEIRIDLSALTAPK